jgi:hypothetical protein
LDVIIKTKMTNTETIKAALIKQIVDSGSTLPLSVLEGNIDLLINTALTERYDAIYNKVIGSHITEPEFKVLESKKYRLNRDFEAHGLKKGDILTCCHHNPNRANKYHLERSAVGIYIHGENLEEVKDELTVEDLKAGDWYVITHRSIDNFDIHKIFLLKFRDIVSNDLQGFKAANCINGFVYDYSGPLCPIQNVLSIRHATREEIIKYFPYEFEIDTHGANDIPQVTDPQL